MIGGGDFKSLPNSMYQCRELIKISDKIKSEFEFVEKK